MSNLIDCGHGSLHLQRAPCSAAAPCCSLPGMVPPPGQAASSQSPHHEFSPRPPRSLRILRCGFLSTLYTPQHASCSGSWHRRNSTGGTKGRLGVHRPARAPSTYSSAQGAVCKRCNVLGHTGGEALAMLPHACKSLLSHPPRQHRDNEMLAALGHQHKDVEHISTCPRLLSPRFRKSRSAASHEHRARGHIPTCHRCCSHIGHAGTYMLAHISTGMLNAFPCARPPRRVAIRLSVA